MKSVCFVLAASMLVGLAVAQDAQPETPKNSDTVRRQYIQAPQPIYAPQQVVQPPPVVVTPVGQCPGGPSLPIECDPKRPWPACPPQSYCYATNSVDIGPYFCCPVWSTYGAAWRPAGPLSDYVPPMPLNWPEEVRRTAAWPASAVNYAPLVARPYRAKTEPKAVQVSEDEQDKIEQVMNDWLDRQARKH
uniref:Signal peptide protein n=1 Tax=Panagrellus redivivus TaxID=6233 RepID=A0A7E4W740_PANRE